ncbi:MAG: hypothetical protein ACLUDY_10745 [Bacteroides xylanisolvens]
MVRESGITGQTRGKDFIRCIIANGQIDTKDLPQRDQSRCTLNEVDVTAVLDALSQVMGEELCEGEGSAPGRYGYFYRTNRHRRNRRRYSPPEYESKVERPLVPFRPKTEKLTSAVKIKQMKKELSTLPNFRRRISTAG